MSTAGYALMVAGGWAVIGVVAMILAILLGEGMRAYDWLADHARLARARRDLRAGGSLDHGWRW